MLKPRSSQGEINWHNFLYSTATLNVCHLGNFVMSRNVDSTLQWSRVYIQVSTSGDVDWEMFNQCGQDVCSTSTGKTFRKGCSTKAALSQNPFLSYFQHYYTKYNWINKLFLVGKRGGGQNWTSNVCFRSPVFYSLFYGADISEEAST